MLSVLFILPDKYVSFRNSSIKIAVSQFCLKLIISKIIKINYST